MKPVIIRNEHSPSEGAGEPGVRDKGIIQVIFYPSVGSAEEEYYQSTEIIKIRHFSESGPVTISLERSEFREIERALSYNDELLRGTNNLEK